MAKKVVLPAKRNIRTYKVEDVPYRKAMKNSLNEGIPLATFLERIVVGIAKGKNILIVNDNGC